MNVPLKNRLRTMGGSVGGYNVNDVQKTCREALAEIERLEARDRLRATLEGLRAQLARLDP